MMGKRKRTIVLCCLLPCLAAGVVCFTTVACAPCPEQSAFADLARGPAGDEPIVQLRCATIPWTCAVHCWFAEFDPADGRWHRWEVWQTAGSGPADWGHIRKDLMPPDTGVGGGESWALAQWTGPAAQRLHDALNAPLEYPYRDKYAYWPGPNSNTYAAWILSRAGVEEKLPCGAVGKDYRIVPVSPRLGVSLCIGGGLAVRRCRRVDRTAPSGGA